MNAEQTTVTRRFIKRPAMKVKTAEEEEEKVVPRPPSPAPESESEPEEEGLVCPHCERTEKECQEEATNEKNPITHWMGGWGLSCDDCYYATHPEFDDEEDDDDETESVASEPSSEDAECQTDPLPATAVGVTERRVYDVVDEQVSQMEETIEERLAEMRRQMMEETERMLSAKLAQLAVAHPAVQKQSKKAEKEAKKQEEIRGYYEVPATADEIARLRQTNRELRKTSEGQINTNRKLQERIAELEGEDPVRVYAEEIKKVREINQKLRKRCEAKDRTYQKMKAMIEALGGKAPDAVRDDDE
jgi:hypothetical protein